MKYFFQHQTIINIQDKVFVGTLNDPTNNTTTQIRKTFNKLIKSVYIEKELHKELSEIKTQEDYWIYNEVTFSTSTVNWKVYKGTRNWIWQQYEFQICITLRQQLIQKSYENR